MNVNARFRFAISLSACLLAWANPGAADEKGAAEAGWIKDSKGCKISNPNPKPKESVTWSGPCPKGIADGTGVLQFSVDGKEGARYEGDLKQGVMSGRGKLKMADGATYDGDWVDGKPDGYGKYIAPNGSSFVGGWTDGQQDGPGTYRDPAGGVTTGTWKGGKYVGPQ
jgi:hypothetical protein